jgi:hypothetical protein
MCLHIFNYEEPIILGVDDSGHCVVGVKLQPFSLLL